MAFCESHDIFVCCRVRGDANDQDLLRASRRSETIRCPDYRTTAHKYIFVGIRIIDFLTLVISHLRRAFEEGFWAGVGSSLANWYAMARAHPYRVLV